MLMAMPVFVADRGKVPHDDRSMSVSNDGDKGCAVSHCWVVGEGSETVEIKDEYELISSTEQVLLLWHRQSTSRENQSQGHIK